MRDLQPEDLSTLRTAAAFSVLPYRWHSAKEPVTKLANKITDSLKSSTKKSL
jgi:hypothetical protein